ncbi:MAG: DUF460 domain-containing protein [Candidatus Heimdallarchaeota archaeon]|nr:MAG: DUF460 domain-containing protein [Candidatus Heimdallarchaeota archaeon]
MSKSSIIFGLDILARSSRSSKGSIFSLVVLTYDHCDKYPKLNRRTLFKKIEDLKPDYIAMDNIFELSPSAKGIIRFLQKIPINSQLVQVTGSPRTGMEKITTLIRKHRLKKELSFPFSSHKLSSLETAEVCARLCQKHVGHEILAFEEEICIRISKKKSHGRGGSSASRYERISRAAVNHAADEVELILRDRGVTWDVFEYPQRRVYIAMLEKGLISEIQVMLKPLTTELVRVTLERITKSNLEFQPLDVSIAPTKRSLRNIILGVDPGTTTGIAVIDLMKGNVLYLKSKRECGISEIIRTASNFGKICCVAADVTPIPATVEKIAKITGAKLLSPSVLISAAAKREYLQEYRDVTVNYSHLNSHERDALFGAIKAYNSLKEQLTKITHVVQDSHPELISKLSEIQRLVISGNSIANAIEMTQGKMSTQKGLKTEEEPDQLTISLKHEIDMLQAKIEAIHEEMDKLDTEVLFWQKQARDGTAQIKEWKDKYERERLKRSDLMQKRISAAVDREVGRIREENQEIRRILRQNQQEMEKLKQIKNFWVQGREIPLKVVKSFNDSAIRETEKNYGLNDGDIVLVLDPSGGGAQTAQKMIDIGIRGVIIPEDSAKFSDQALSRFEDNCVPCLQLPLMDFSVRTEDLNQPKLEIWVYDGLYLTDIGIKEEIRKKELKLREKLRQRRMSLILKAKKSSKVQVKTEVDIEKLLTDFKEDYIEQYQSDYEDKIDYSSEEE